MFVNAQVVKMKLIWRQYKEILSILTMCQKDVLRFKFQTVKITDFKKNLEAVKYISFVISAKV
jgi:hypothetical protein